jgi:Putative zinc-finger
MSCPHETDVGTYVLGVLEPEERARVAAHLRGCPVCSRTLTELAPLPPLLAAVRPGDLQQEAPPVPSELAFQRLRRAALPGRPPRRRNRWLLAAAAAVVVAGGVGTGVAITSGAPGPTTVQAGAGAVHARATIAAEGTGSGITLTMDGLPRGATCSLVAVGRNGERDRTRSWTVDYDGDLHWTGTVALAPDELDRLEVVTDDGRTLVTLPV